MTTLKKPLSVVLCLAMLLGTFAICVTADATTGVKTYNDLVTANTVDGVLNPFVYFGSDVYENYGTEEQALTDGVVSPGQVLHVKQYVKTSQTVGSTAGAETAISVMLDKAVFEIVENSWTSYTSNPEGTYTIVDGTSYVSDSATTASKYLYGPDGNGGMKALKGVLDNKVAVYTQAQVEGWTVLRYVNTSKDAASTAYASDAKCYEFDVKVKNDAAVNATGNIFVPKTIYTGYTAGTATSNINNFILDKKTATKVSWKVWSDEDAKHEFTVKKEKVTATFVVDNNSTSVEGAPLKDLPAGTVPQLDDTYLGWAGPDGKIVTEVTSFLDDDATFTAVKKGTKTTITLDVGESATIEGATEFQVEIGSTFNVADYNANVPVNENENLVYSWDKDGFTVDTINPITVTAIWNGAVDIKVMSLAGEFRTALTITGEPGDSFSYEDIAQINSNVEAIKAAINYAGEGKTPGNYDIVFNVDGAKEIPVAKGGYYYLYTNPDDGNSFLTSAKAAEIVYGVSTTDLYIQPVIQYIVNQYKPVLDEDKVYIEGQWELASSKDVNFNWKLGSDPTTGEPFDHSYYIADNNQYKLNDTLGTIEAVTIVNPTFDLNTYVCEVGAKGVDKNGAEVNISGDKYVINQSNVNPGTQVIDVYPVLSEKAYGVVINVNGTDMASKATFTYEAEATVADFDEVGYYKISDMVVDAGNAYKGKKLVGLYLSSDENKENNLVNGGKLVFDIETIETNIKGKTNNLMLTPEWEDGEYAIDFYYMASNGEWKVLFTNTYIGDKSVKFSDIPGDLQKKINDEMPVGKVLSANTGLTYTAGGTAYDQFKLTSGGAYAEGKTKAYVAYGTDQIYYYDIFNETAFGTNEDGTSAASTSNYSSNPLPYGTVLYKPDYDQESGESKPYYNSIVDGTAPASDPDIKTIENEDGSTRVIDLKGSVTSRPYRNCEYIGYKVYYVDGNYANITDLPPKSEWKEGFNATEGDYTLKTTVIFERQWKADKDFLVRVYGINGNNETKIYMGIGKDFTKYYWNNDHTCKAGENTLVAFEGYFAMGFMPKLDNFDIKRFFDITMWQEVSLRLDVISMSKDLLNPAEWGKILGAAFTALKNLL